MSSDIEEAPLGKVDTEASAGTVEGIWSTQTLADVANSLKLPFHFISPPDSCLFKIFSHAKLSSFGPSDFPAASPLVP